MSSSPFLDQLTTTSPLSVSSGSVRTSRCDVEKLARAILKVNEECKTMRECSTPSSTNSSLPVMQSEFLQESLKDLKLAENIQELIETHELDDLVRIIFRSHQAGLFDYLSKEDWESFQTAALKTENIKMIRYVWGLYSSPAEVLKIFLKSDGKTPSTSGSRERRSSSDSSDHLTEIPVDFEPSPGSN